LTSFGAQASGVSQPGSPRSALKKQLGGVRTRSVKPLHDADDVKAARKSLVGLVIAGRCPAKDPHVLKNIFSRAARFVMVFVPRAVLFAVRLTGDGCAVHASKKKLALGKISSGPGASDFPNTAQGDNARLCFAAESGRSSRCARAAQQGAFCAGCSILYSSTLKR
jgi:hypothetical protein